MKYLIGLCLALVLSATSAAENGKLLIVGGALSPDNEAVYRTFLNSVPSGKNIAIISAASGSPVTSAGRMRDDFIRHGFAAERIITIRLATEDDENTPEDESRWAGNAADNAELRKLENAGAVWFTGGDQARITATLLAEGKDTPMAARLRQILKDGGIIGGTSAGAAMMSQVMIGEGEPLQSLLHGTSADHEGTLRLAQGMGFMPVGLVDQHFDQRRRLGRLARAISYMPGADRLGLGIDENTGFLVDMEGGTISVMGEGALTLLDGRAATFTDSETGLVAEGLILHVFTDGDRLDLTSGKPEVAPYKKRTVGREYYDTAAVSGGGMAFAYPGIADYLGSSLLDNGASKMIEAISFDGTGHGIRYSFRQWPESNGFWGRAPDGQARYSITGVRFTIEPVQVSIQ